MLKYTAPFYWCVKKNVSTRRSAPLLWLAESMEDRLWRWCGDLLRFDCHEGDRVADSSGTSGVGGTFSLPLGSRTSPSYKRSSALLRARGQNGNLTPSHSLVGAVAILVWMAISIIMSNAIDLLYDSDVVTFVRLDIFNESQWLNRCYLWVWYCQWFRLHITLHCTVQLQFVKGFSASHWFSSLDDIIFCWFYGVGFSMHACNL